MRWFAGLLLSGYAATAAASVPADPVEVGVRAAGVPGNWQLTFWIKSNLAQAPDDMAIKVFGLFLPESSELLAQPGFDADRYHSQWDHSAANGGPKTQFNHSWAESGDKILPSDFRDGFTVQIRQHRLPETVPWFVLARSEKGGEYRGSGHFGLRDEPGFAGELSLQAVTVPEPATYGLLGLGLAFMMLARLAAPRSVASAHAG